MRRLLALLAALVAAAPVGTAHDGPPYPILVDHAFGDRTLSVWADPDVGVGTFDLYLPEEEEGRGAEDTIVALVRPADGRLAEARHVARPADPGQPYQRVVLADFDARGPWRVRFELDARDSAGAAPGVDVDVDVTPPGLGPIDVLWFASPFLAVAFLWAKAVLRRRSHPPVSSNGEPA